MKQLLFVFVFCTCAMLGAESRRVIGTGPGGRVLARDTARYNVGDWLYMPDPASKKPNSKDPLNGYKKYVLAQKDIDWAKNEARKEDVSFMSGFSPTLPDIDTNGREYMAYKRSDEHIRKLYDDGAVEDTITNEHTFDEAFAELKRKYSAPVPRNNNARGSGVNWIYVDSVPTSFPTGIFWASISLEGRLMKVIIANGKNHRFAMSIWATPEFVREFPDTKWSWKKADSKPGKRAAPIMEDLSTAQLFEFKE